MSQIELKERVINILSGHTTEMERYDYYGSNPGVPEDHYEEIANEVIAGLAPQWLPIESAPRDGTPYLASDGVNQRVENCPEGHAAGIWHHIDGNWRGVAFGDDSKYWQPLPAPPEVKP